MPAVSQQRLSPGWGYTRVELLGFFSSPLPSPPSARTRLMQLGFCNHFLSPMKTCRGSSQLALTARGWRTARQPLFQLAFPFRLDWDANLGKFCPKFLFFSMGRREPGLFSASSHLTKPRRTLLSSDTSWLSIKQS